MPKRLYCDCWPATEPRSTSGMPLPAGLMRERYASLKDVGGSAIGLVHRIDGWPARSD